MATYSFILPSKYTAGRQYATQGRLPCPPLPDYSLGFAPSASVQEGKNVGPNRLNDQEVACLVKRAALAAGVCGDMSEYDRKGLVAGHSLGAGLALSAEIDERYVLKQIGHASAYMARRYQRRRDRFRVNLTKAAGL